MVEYWVVILRGTKLDLNWDFELIQYRENFLKSSPLTPEIVKTRSEFTWIMSIILWMTKNDHCYFWILFHFLQFEQYISISLFLVWEARLFKNLLLLWIFFEFAFAFKNHFFDSKWPYLKTKGSLLTDSILLKNIKCSNYSHLSHLCTQSLLLCTNYHKPNEIEWSDGHSSKTKEAILTTHYYSAISIVDIFRTFIPSIVFIK